ncbi:hypothetical protein A0128_06985 [Leptospira tipperaryensis]|uniref:Uncharacterized protein n=1 Tax=Leptospira tipperaryensis TaxID=2564040 RepID=A0A1D7UVP4_9LEPT|nr:hypothetical protein A0128_06985 [Leptospira tipperaryensis]
MGRCRFCNQRHRYKQRIESKSFFDSFKCKREFHLQAVSDYDLSTLKKIARFKNGPRDYDIDVNENVSKDGEVESITYSFATQAIGNYRIKLYLQVACSLL